MTTAALRASDTLGRFELRRVLGQGAQSTVWLAFDPRMEREVAIKVMRPGADSDTQAIAQWLQEARSVSRVAHPNIVAVHEADIQDFHPYLVFEYVAGQTLSQLLLQRGALPPAEAVGLMMDVLDAIAAAHAAGVVHRDLKPSNVLVDANGHAWVTDFGIAARIRDKNDSGHTTPSGGTAGYMSPEAANGEAPSVCMDIFSAGVVLAELLIGKPLIQEKDAHRAIYRVLNEQLVLPANMNADVNDQLRAIVMRAIAKDPVQRFASARTFWNELELWTKPLSSPVQGATASHHGTLEFMLRRIRHKSDFPALSDSVIRIQKMATSETESINSVTNEILKDVALTNKLLRLVNSAYYGRGGNIGTVSRAVSLVGFDGIRNIALSLVLLEHMQDKVHAAHLKDEFLRSLMAGSIASEMCPLRHESEESFIGTMFQNLGRLLVEFYFPEEARQIHNLMQSKRESVTENTASMRILGLSLEQLGLGVAKTWGLPESIQCCMRKPEGPAPSRTPKAKEERMRWLALAANEIADILLQYAPGEIQARIIMVTRKYAQVLGTASSDLLERTVRGRLKLIDMATAMEIKVAHGSLAAKLLTPPDTGAKPIPAEVSLAEDRLENFELQPTQPMLPQSNNVVIVKTTRVAQVLTAGIQDVTNAMVEDFKLSDVLRMILETMYRAMEFDRVIFCMREAKTDMMTGRFGLGSEVEAHVKTFKFPLKEPPLDLFAVVCAKGSDTMISDAHDAPIVHRLPDWYRKGLNAPTFLLLPLQLKGSAFGLIYADKKLKGALELDEKELGLLRTLRNQALMAFKQSS